MKKEQLYDEEEKILSEARELAKQKDLSSAELKKGLEKLSEHYEELLNNAKLITSISDRFQEKLKLANDKLQIQAEEINRINLELDADNRALKGDLTKLTKARVLSHHVSYEEFVKAYPDKNVCLKFLAELKWREGFKCRKCGNEKFCDGKTNYSRRCTKCRYDESPSAYTIYHKCKFEMAKAFYITMLVSTQKGKISSYELSRILAMRQKTCWSFKQKVLDSMKKMKDKKQIKDQGWSALAME